MVPQYPDAAGQLRVWARGFVRSAPTDTLALLKDLSVGVAERILYQSRDDEGTQSPIETLDRGWGSCRDFAVLFVEAARSLGFGARIVSGYLYNPEREREVGTSHAWAEVFVPGAGWITFDPTNRGVGGFNLIPVAVRDIRQAMPVSAVSRNDRRLSGHVYRSRRRPAVRRRTMTDEMIDPTGAAEWKPHHLRRLLAEVEANERTCARQDELEAHLAAAPAANWPEAAEKARYVLGLYAATLPTEDTRRRTLIAAVLADFERLAREP